MKKKILAGLVIGLMMFGAVHAANALVIVDYTVNDEYGRWWGTGSFTGNDDDADGYLEFGELISFNGSNNIESENVSLSDLVDIGDYNIAGNQWLNNGIGWTDYYNAYFTWDGGDNSVCSTWATVETKAGAPVPEPGTMMLLGIGIAGLAIYGKRRKNNRF